MRNAPAGPREGEPGRPAAAMPAGTGCPDEYALEAYTDDGLREAFVPDEIPDGYGRPDCADIGMLIPAFPGDDAGVATAARVPPGPYEDANWESTDYVEAIGARWDPARTVEIVDGCDTSTTTDGKLSVTVRRIEMAYAVAPVARPATAAAEKAADHLG